MRTYPNLFEIWKANDKRLPFLTKRYSWVATSVLVTRIEDVKETKTGTYGKAYGIFYNSGKKVTKKDSPFKKNYVDNYEAHIYNAGCYAWVYIPPITVIKRNNDKILTK